MLLTSGLDNLTNDFPLNPAFVPFIEQTARYLAGSERQGGARPVDAYPNSATRGKKPESKSPIPKTIALSARRGREGPIPPAHQSRLLPAPLANGPQMKSA